MTPNASRRQFFKSTGAVSAAAMLGGAGVTACGGDSSGSNISGVAALSADEQLALTATQALAANKAGSLTATAYVTN